MKDMEFEPSTQKKIKSSLFGSNSPLACRRNKCRTYGATKGSLSLATCVIIFQDTRLTSLYFVSCHIKSKLILSRIGYNIFIIIFFFLQRQNDIHLFKSRDYIIQHH